MSIEILSTPLISAFIMGFLGSSHCMGMCGGITVALGASTDTNKHLSLSLTYQIFRVLSYGLLGIVVGFIGSAIEKWSNFPWLVVIGGILLIMMGFYLLGWWSLLSLFEKGGQYIWKKVSPIQKKFLPLSQYHQAMVVGLLWGLLPCGLVYSALAMASTSSSPVNGFLTMLAFGLGTLPALLAAGVFSHKLLGFFKKNWVRTTLGMIFIVWGCWQLYGVLLSKQNPHAHHQQHSMEQQTKAQDHSHHH
ncbi:MAG: sulfite exporter TauE/SafE family protein [Kangiellaceae bacterium]|nr:sulfite exporter TauE/SafE family protein [Kangiellaceae bacterium]